MVADSSVCDRDDLQDMGAPRYVVPRCCPVLGDTFKPTASSQSSSHLRCKLFAQEEIFKCPFTCSEGCPNENCADPITERHG